jgi:Lrp/AsnC family transcriptional regulator for asnA, asnC and gidA
VLGEELTPKMHNVILVAVVDDLDRRLIAELAGDARQTSAQLSRKLGVSDTTVRRRIYRLQQHRIISSTVVPDAAKLGYTIIAIIALQVDLGSIDEVGRCLVDYPNVRYVADCTGSHDMFVGAWFHSSHELSRFVKDHLAKMPGIRRSETFVILDVKKNQIGWLQRSGQTG